DLAEGLAEAVRIKRLRVEQRTRCLDEPAGQGRHDRREESGVVVVRPPARGGLDERPRRDGHARDIARVRDEGLAPTAMAPPATRGRHPPAQRADRTHRSGHWSLPVWYVRRTARSQGVPISHTKIS